LAHGIVVYVDSGGDRTVWSNLRKLKQILTKGEVRQSGLLLVVGIVVAFSQMLGVASLMPFLSLITDSGIIEHNRLLNWIYENLGFTSTRSFMIFTGAAMFAIVVLSNALAALSTWMMLTYALKNNHRLSERLLEKYLGMPYVYFLDQNSTDLGNNVLNEVNQLTYRFILPLLTVISKGLVAIFILVLFFWIDIWIALTALLVFGGAYSIIYVRINRKLKERGARRLQANQKRYKLVGEAFSGIKEIKVLHRESFFVDAYSEESLQMIRDQSWNAVIGQIPRFALEAIAFGGIILFVLVLIVTEKAAGEIISLSGLFAFAGYRLIPALQEIFNALTSMRFNQAVLDRVHKDITQIVPQEPLSGNLQGPANQVLGFKKEIKLEHLKYRYPAAKSVVLDDISLTIGRNTSIAFVGQTGAGKTTLADIILGLLVPEQGSMLVDGVMIEASNRAAWQRTLGYVAQHIHISDDTIRHNIAFGIPEAGIDQNAVERAARIANLDSFITEELTLGYETIVGERGVRLSGGQRQRIGIARALYHDPEVLVFDEATSALDGVTEEAVLTALRNAARFKTLIIIAHRLTTVRDCNCIYIMEKGKIVGNGTFDELMETSAVFRNLAKK
jgi:ABC-type multidrug transport system fused ATPase/permease subunit